MTHDVFNVLLHRRLELTKMVLGRKAGEYATGGDRLHNFKMAAIELGGSPAENAWGMLKKHLISVRDLILSNEPVSQAVADEKIGDCVNYLVLLEALFEEGRGAKCPN